MLNRPDVKITTVIMFIQEFSNCLSDKERDRVFIQLETIKQLSLKQITIDTCIDNEKTNNLEQTLKKLKSKF